SIALAPRQLVHAPPFFFNHPATAELYTLSLHDALPICDRGATGRLPATLVRGRDIHRRSGWYPCLARTRRASDRHHGGGPLRQRSEEHTSELQSRENLVCRLLLEKKKIGEIRHIPHPKF